MKNDQRDTNSGNSTGAELAGLFAEDRYEFQMRMRRRGIADYFRAPAGSAGAIAERQRLLHESPHRYFAFSPQAEDCAREAIALLSEAGVVFFPPASVNIDDRGSFLAVSLQLDPDLVLLCPDDAGDLVMAAGCVCFPSSWSLEEKMGRSLLEIHAPVPGLNERLGPSIAQFLKRMSPGTAWCRENWGLSASPELNQHPSRSLPRLMEDVALEGVWMRVERQALVALPKTGCVLFAIRVEVTSLSEVASHPECRAGLRRSLETMPEPIASYKGLSRSRKPIIALLS